MKKAPYTFKFDWKEVFMCLAGLGLLSWAIWTWKSYDYDKQTRAKVLDQKIVYTDENGIEYNINPSKVTIFSRGETLGGDILMAGVIYIACYAAFYMYREKQKPQLIEF